MSQLPAPNRLAILAGGGQLPRHVADCAARAGDLPFLILLENEASGDWSEFEHEWLGIGQFSRLKTLLRQKSISRILMSGSISRRPVWSQIRPGVGALFKLPLILRTLMAGGDHAVLSMVIGLLESDNIRVIGVQDIVPGLLAKTGPLGRHLPSFEALEDIAVATKAARLLGGLDIGQGAVAVGGRVVALEGPEGTDAMLERVLQMRRAGRISSHRQGVLVKLCKAQQDRRVDLPSIGLSTLRHAKAAGLAGIALEAGRSLMLDEVEIRQFADGEGMFVTGLEFLSEPGVGL